MVADFDWRFDRLRNLPPIRRATAPAVSESVAFADASLSGCQSRNAVVRSRSAIVCKLRVDRGEHHSVRDFRSETWLQGLVFAVALGVAVAIFAGVARLLIVSLRRWFPLSWSFALRQGLANLYRPNNRTLLLIVSLGLGTFLLLTIHLTRDVVMTQFQSIGRNNQPNIFLFDIQSDQKDAVAALVGSLGFPVVQQAPIVTMRLAEIKGRKSSDILADPQRKIPEWELEREYRSTYREQLVETEKVTAGKWIGRVDYHSGDVVPISLDDEIAKDLGVNVGDELVFDVQGIPIRTRIASLRSVDWKRFQTNFFVVFPAGVLEAAPTFHVLVSRAKTPADSARFQNAIVSKFPNVSALDLDCGYSNGRFDLEQGCVGYSGDVTVHCRRGPDRGGEYDLEWSLPESRGEHSAADAWGLHARRSGKSFARNISSLAVWRARPASFWPSPRVGHLRPLFSSSLTHRRSGHSLPRWESFQRLTILIGTLTSRGIGNAPPLEILRADAE